MRNQRTMPLEHSSFVLAVVCFVENTNGLTLRMTFRIDFVCKLSAIFCKQTRKMAQFGRFLNVPLRSLRFEHAEPFALADPLWGTWRWWELWRSFGSPHSNCNQQKFPPHVYKIVYADTMARKDVPLNPVVGGAHLWRWWMRLTGVTSCSTMLYLPELCNTIDSRISRADCRVVGSVATPLPFTATATWAQGLQRFLYFTHFFSGS